MTLVGKFMTLNSQIRKSNFALDDGSLPGIEFRDLSASSVRKIVEYFFTTGVIHTVNPTIHDLTVGLDLPLSQVEDPAELVISGGANSFHCCFDGFDVDGIDLPVLGLFVFSDCVDIDYRMGADWTSERIDAFFKFLAQLIAMAPEAAVGSTEVGGLPYPDLFFQELDLHAPNRKK